VPTTRRSPLTARPKFNVQLTGNPVSNESIDLVRDRLRAALHADARPTPGLVTGTTAIFADINSANNRDLSVILPSRPC